IDASYHNTYIRYYGVLNPSEIGYSKTDGLTYRQRISIRKRYSDQQQLAFVPDLSVATRRKEIFIRGIGSWEYRPARLGLFSFSAGNGNQSYPAGMQKAIAELAGDSAKLDALPYFRHYYAELKNQIELTNGLLLTASATYNLRQPSRHARNLEAAGEDAAQLINSKYNDFTVSVGFSYTPRQYYRMDGRQKIVLYSRYPTFSFEFARAIPRLWDAKGNYGRLEADVHQSLRLGELQKLNYHLSAGLYTSKKSAYFAEFRYFAKNNFPDTWSDHIGGVFNLLDRQWFYASDRYAQVHLLYESRFLLLRLFPKAASKYVLAERLYFSQLWTPALPSYTEIGYGIGNHIFNIAAFAAFRKQRYNGIGLKFAFELFR
ncbi:MAG: DUF5686 family protein, partial [Tannerella sp.]|nr:DUF5686 family protein [Tannerella sp.]